MKTKILFVDDDVRVLTSFERIVHPYADEWEFDFVSESETVIDSLVQCPVDVLVTDVKMPKVTGLELLEAVKKHPKLKRIEVIVVTGLGERSFKQRALDLGASDLLNKPISNEELISRIRSTVKVKQSQDELRRKNREMEKQLIAIQKMEVIGLLAGGAVHDLNSIFGIIKGYGELMIEEKGEGSPFHDDLNVILESVDRAMTITRQIHSFSRVADTEKGLVFLNRLLNDIRDSLVATIGKYSEILVDVSLMESCLIEAPESSLYQVCMNLSINAIQAMDGAGKLILRLSQDAKNRICVEFIDTGGGVDEALIDQIFEPLFTTRRDSGGSGLGLSIVRKIMENLKGEVTFQNNDVGGSTFSIYLPAEVLVIETESPNH